MFVALYSVGYDDSSATVFSRKWLAHSDHSEDGKRDFAWHDAAHIARSQLNKSGTVYEVRFMPSSYVFINFMELLQHRAKMLPYRLFL